MKQIITLKDVANAAGVSRVTASFVMNNRHNDLKISEKTCQKVKETAEKLGYFRNEIASSMLTGKSKVIGIVAKNSWTEYSAKIIEGAMIRAAQKGYHVKLIPWEENNIKNVVKQCLSQRLAGIIARSIELEEVNEIFNILSKYNIPVAEVGESLRTGAGIRVLSDDFLGTKLALDHLRMLGHRNIYFATFGSAKSLFSVLRAKAYSAVMAEFNLNASGKTIVFEKDTTDFQNKISSLLKSKKRPTAFFCGGETSAMLCIRVAYELNIKIPETLSIVGYGDSMLSKFATPALTVVHQPFRKLGEEVAEQLIKDITSKNMQSLTKPIEKILPVQLTERNTTAKARQDKDAQMEGK